MIRINEIIDQVKTYIENPKMDLIERAYVFSATAHQGQTRLSGEPYLSHPLEVANLLAKMKLDEASIAAGLLHDTVEDTKTTIDEIEELFGEDVADIVDGVTKISMMQFDSKATAKAENIRKLILAMAEDIRVLMVKLADRLHNMRTLDFQKDYKQKLIAQETLDIYAPLANRLGLHQVKVALEDLCLKYTRPDSFNMIADGVARHHTSGKDYVDTVIGLLEDMLKENGIKGRVTGRTKHIYSIYNKMKRQHLTLDEVHDLVAFRCIVRNKRDCYSVLGAVHAAWMPVPGRFKDYISIPKANMYQSLHTTVIGPEGEPVEIQIRTEDMHGTAEYGVAAHWQYKETGQSKAANTKSAEKFTWLRQILDWQRDMADSKEFMSSLRVELFDEELYVFTPGGEVKDLPVGSTPVDFAYSIHTEVGNHCAGAKVDGRLVPLNTPLTNGVRVEIITDKKRSPSRDWLKFVKTAKAKTRIKHWIRTEERGKTIVLGKEMLEKEGRKMSMNVAKLMKEGWLQKLAEDFSCGSEDDLLSNVGYFRITARKVLKRLWSKLHGDEEKKAEKESQAEKPQQASKVSEGIKIQGVDHALFRFANCCNPLPGDPIVGYVTRGRGVTVHTADCPNVKNFEPERFVDITWGGEEEDGTPYPVKINIRCRNVKGLLSKISTVLFEQDVNIDSGTFISNVDGTSELEFTVEVKDSGHLYRAINKLTSIPNVLEVIRHQPQE